MSGTINGVGIGVSGTITVTGKQYRLISTTLSTDSGSPTSITSFSLDPGAYEMEIYGDTIGSVTLGIVLSGDDTASIVFNQGGNTTDTPTTLPMRSVINFNSSGTLSLQGYGSSSPQIGAIVFIASVASV